MCGIAGFWRPGDAAGATMADRQAMLERMLASIRHRGPDDVGAVICGEEGPALGNARLSIIDLAGGHQPMAVEGGRIQVIFNGEIYNYRQLREELSGLGHAFRTRSDTEVVARAYVQWGIQSLPRLNGMLALALWDDRSRTLWLARDRMGKKPLYLYQAPAAGGAGPLWVFGSEVKALLDHPAVPRAVDEEAIDAYLSLGFVPGPRTGFANIEKVPPGTAIGLHADGRVTREVYWRLPAPAADDSGRSEADWQEELGALLADSTELRLLASDVPVGLFLSGGLDSSALLATIRQRHGRPLKTFSMRFADAARDEGHFARLVAARFGTEHREFSVESVSPELVQRLVWHVDEPNSDPAMLPTYLLSRHAREEVKVVLTGEGADELFAGYGYQREVEDIGGRDGWPDWLRRDVLPAAAGAVNALLRRERYHARTRWAWALPAAARALAYTAVFTDAERRAFRVEPYRAAAEQRLALAAPPSNGRRPSALGRQLYIEQGTSLVDGLLLKVDKMTMAASLEARCPYLDFRLVELAARMPDALKLGQGEGKRILRDLMRDQLPPETIARPKHGFDVPLEHWLSGDLRALFHDRVQASPFQNWGILPPASLDRLWQDMERGVPGRARQLWSLLWLAEWQAAFGLA